MWSWQKVDLDNLETKLKRANCPTEVIYEKGFDAGDGKVTTTKQGIAVKSMNLNATFYPLNGDLIISQDNLTPGERMAAEIHTKTYKHNYDRRLVAAFAFFYTVLAASFTGYVLKKFGVI